VFFELVDSLKVDSLPELEAYGASSRPLIEGYLELKSNDNLLLEVSYVDVHTRFVSSAENWLHDTGAAVFCGMMYHYYLKILVKTKYTHCLYVTRKSQSMRVSNALFFYFVV
jgi:hypothetical protein